MPRSPRAWVPGGIYHVFSRGSNRHVLFLYDSDREWLLNYTGTVIERYTLVCLAYVFMTNHIHWLFGTPETDEAVLSNALRDLNGTYARRFNRRHGREAHAFQNRFGAVLQESEGQLLWTLRYIPRNPVEAGLCIHPSEWPWSSYRATAGLETPPPFLAVAKVLELFGANVHTAMARYVEFIEADPGV